MHHINTYGACLNIEAAEGMEGLFHSAEEVDVFVGRAFRCGWAGVLDPIGENLHERPQAGLAYRLRSRLSCVSSTCARHRTVPGNLPLCRHV